MKATLTTMIGNAALALVLTLIPGRTWAADAAIPQNPQELVKAMTEAGRPGPEHAKLQPLAGSWTYTCKFWMDPSQPPMESTGTIERRWVLGGRFLEELVEGTGFDGQPFEGRGLYGYDNGQKKYTSSWVCSMGTGTCAGLGDADPSGKKFTFQTEAFCPLMKKVIQGRDEVRIETNDRIVAESFVIEDGQEMKMMELVATRQK